MIIYAASVPVLVLELSKTNYLIAVKRIFEHISINNRRLNNSSKIGSRNLKKEITLGASFEGKLNLMNANMFAHIQPIVNKRGKVSW